MALTKSFHSSVDTSRAYQAFDGASWIYLNPFITIKNRSLTYQFFPHFHAYVPPLIQRLNDGGFSELQDSDTLYQPQPNPPLGPPVQPPLPITVLPNSTRANLLTNVAANRPDGTPISLPVGTPLTLPDQTTVNIKTGTVVQLTDGSTSTLAAPASLALPGQLPVSFSSGIQFKNAGTDTILPDSTTVTVTLPAGATFAILTNDGTSVRLPPATAVAIRSGLPLPYFYKDDFGSRYHPDATNVLHPYPVKDIDFTYNGAYSIYNWELFFHAPLLIAVHLSQNQKFQDAQNWFHYIFNPTDNSVGPTPQRFWKVQPFQYTDVELIEKILTNLSNTQDGPLYDQTISSINEWREHPFQPWAVAKFRPTAYMLKTVMAYLDNLIAWGDSLFQQYTIETINEATQIYIMAANILGDKPQAVPKKGSVKPLTYNDLRNAKIDAFGNALVDMEVDIPFDLTAASGSGTERSGSQILTSIGQTLYFCIPRNDKLLSYWDTVADRLFKIHNSLNIQGVFQQLPLFDPPIDPALLVRATAAGLDVSAVVSGLNQPLPLVRFQVLVSKASEICQEVKSLGANLLSAIEKQDNESISLLRAQHENAILGLANVVKYSQWQEAAKATQALQLSLATTTQRYAYYQKVLGRTDAQIQSSLPQLDPLDLAGLQNLNFTQADSSAEPQMGLDPIDPKISQDATSVSDGEIKTLSNHEVEEINKLTVGHDFQIAASVIDAVGAVLGLVPQFNAHAQPLGVGVTAGFGGVQLRGGASSLASVSRALAEEFSFEANKAGKLGSYSRREVEWTFQSNSAKSEINQIFKQLRAAQIREAIAKKEYDNHQTQMANAQQVVDFLQGNYVGPGFPVKETTIGFYALLKRDVKALYAKAFQLAFEVAKKSERALQNELGDPSLTYIQFNYLDGNEGLLAGEKLLFDIKTMEMAYHDLNQREYELTKHVSLRQVDPLALVQLRATGSCTFTMPEEMFDMDGPGHYFRRIKSVAVTLPCVAGPYTSVNCTVTMQKSSIRISTDPGTHYVRQGSDDPRFNDYYGTIQSIVTSSGQADSGLFETNLRDERYLPFEGVGPAGSQWQISLPSEVKQFDFDTITDVVVHVRYTAREGGDLLRAAAVRNLEDQIKHAQTVGSICLFSIRHEFPSAWAKFQSGAALPAELSLTLTPELYPFWAQKPVIKSVDFLAQTTSTTPINVTDPTGPDGTLVSNPLLGNLLAGTLTRRPQAVTDAAHLFNLFFDDNSMQDLWIAIKWGTA
jgi:hypothetical protein